MNNAKKSIKGEVKQKKNQNLQSSEGMIKPIIFGIMGFLLVAVLVVVAWEGLAPKYLVSVNGEKLKQEDLIYDIYEAESIGAQMASIYAQFGSGDDYFNMVNEDGTTTQDNLRDQVVSSYLYNRILYSKAVEAGYEATEEEKTQAAESAKTQIESLTEEKAKKLGLNDILEKRMLEDIVVARYKQDNVDSFDIDDDAIKAGVDYETYRGYNVEYFYIGNTETNEAGESVAIEDKDGLKNQLQTVLDKAGTGDWSKVIDAEDETQKVSYGTKTITKEDEDTFSADLTKKILAMNNSDLTGIVEEEDGYYAFRMVDNDSKEVYDQQVEEAITAKEEEQFTAFYEDFYSDYEVKLYENNWKNVIFGTITLS